MQTRSAEFERELVDFGFAPDVSSVYTFVLTRGSMRSSALGSLPLSRRRLEDSVEALVRLGLLAQMRLDGHRHVYAVDPMRAWTSRIAQLVWAEATELAPIRALPVTRHPGTEALRKRLERIRTIAVQVAAEIDPLPVRLVSAERDPRRMVVVEREELLASLMAEAIANARKQIRAVSRPPRIPQLAAIWDALTQRMTEGVRYRRITDVSELVSHGLAIVRRDLYESGVELRVIELSRVRKSFYVIDRDLLVLKADAEAAEGQATRGAVTRFHSMIGRYISQFERLWEDAVDARWVVPEIQGLADQFLQAAKGRVSHRSLEWLDSVIRFGRFAGPPDEDPDAAEIVEQELRRVVDLVERGLAYGAVLPNYPNLENVLDTVRHRENSAEEPPCGICWEPIVRCRCI